MIKNTGINIDLISIYMKKTNSQIYIPLSTQIYDIYLSLNLEPTH